jgi:mycofactocin system glycosyltransferase
VSSGLSLDPGARVLDDGRTLLGGDPPRALRLSDAGASVVRELLAGRPPAGEAGRVLAERLLEAGLAHPRPREAPAAALTEVTVVVPVRDRPAELARCLAALAAEPPGRVLVVDDGSADPAALGAVCAGAGAELVRCASSGGPAAARNAALPRLATDFVAFLDSDCVPEPGWLTQLCAVAAADPRLGAVAPRIVALPTAGGGGGGGGATGGALDRFAQARAPLDLGPRPAAVRPGGRVAYLPTAALLVRRAALGAGFDPALRHGEDVDLVWRLHDAGWRVRYAPGARVGHAEPARLSARLRRRYHYGTAAGPLARRHPARLAPAVIHPRPALVAALLAGGRPRSALVAFAVHAGVSARPLRRLRVPFPAATGLAARGVLESAVGAGRAATMLAPVGLALGLVDRRTRRAALALTLAAPAREYVRIRPGLDPVRWTLLCVIDDVAYGTGVWVGALRARTVAPLRPRIAGSRSPGPGPLAGGAARGYPDHHGR